jgi:hypothetical protein
VRQKRACCYAPALAPAIPPELVRHVQQTPSSDSCQRHTNWLPFVVPESLVALDPSLRQASFAGLRNSPALFTAHRIRVGTCALSWHTRTAPRTNTATSRSQKRRAQRETRPQCPGDEQRLLNDIDSIFCNNLQEGSKMTELASGAKPHPLVVGDDNSPLQCSPDCLRPVTHIEFGKDADGVIANSVFAITED